MLRSLRFSLANILLVISCFALAIGWWATVHWSHVPTVDIRHWLPNEAIHTLPITISASEVGRFRNGKSWYLSVNSAGQADLTIDNNRKGRVQRFQISDDQLNDLRRLLAFHDDFFLLDDDYGQIVPNGNTRTLTICVGGWTKTARLHFLGNWADLSQEDREGSRKAIIVWDRIRGWFEYPEAVDSRDADKQIFDTAEGKQ